MKSPRSAFPTWSTYVPSVGPVGTGGAVNYNLAAMYGPRGGGPGLARTSDIGRAAQIAAAQLATAAGIGAGVGARMANRPITTALEQSRRRWAQHDWAEDVGDRAHQRGELQGPPNMPGDVGSRLGWPADQAEPPKTVQIGDQTIDIAAFNARGVEAQQRSGQGSSARTAFHGNPAAAATAVAARQTMGAAAAEVISDPKLIIPTTFSTRKK